MRRRRLRTLWDGLAALRERCPERDRLLKAVAVLQHKAGRAASLIEVRIPPAGQPVTAETFAFRLRRDAFRTAWRRDGSYLLWGSLAAAADPAVLWEQYMLMTEIEAAFKCLKSELALRPVYHQVPKRVEAHIFVAFLDYCLMATLKMRLRPQAPGLTPQAVLDKLGAIQMVDVCLPTTDGRWLIMPRHTQPEPEQRLLLDLLGLSLPPQPPPRITIEQLAAAPQELWPPPPAATQSRSLLDVSSPDPFAPPPSGGLFDPPPSPSL